MIDLNEVLVFTKVVESGSFSGAARLLGQPRATVSRKVTQLEAELGIRLLHRTTRKLNLTQPGREYYLKCSSALSEIETAYQELSEAQQSPSGLLRITAPLVSQSGFLCDWITEFLTHYKEVSIKVALSDDVVDLIEDGFDVAFRAGQLKDSSLVARKLGSTKLVVCATPRYLKQAPALTSIKDIKHHEVIAMGHYKEKPTWHLQSTNENEVVQIDSRVTVNSMEFVLQSCLAGLGIALLPIAMIGEYVKTKHLQVVLNNYSADIGGLYVIYPSKLHLSTTVKTFVDFILSKASGGLPWNHEDA